MSLIHCYKCGKEISDRALSCPYCGASASISEEKSNNLNVVDEFKKKQLQNESAVCFILF